jgi:quercetin 2,3-dioxygenase
MDFESNLIATKQPIFDVQRATERATFDHGWLLTSHSFSFADYFDPRNVNRGALRVFNDDRVAPGAGFPNPGSSNTAIVSATTASLDLVEFST